MHKQRGVSMLGFMFMSVAVIIIAMLAMKLVPAYIEFFSVKKILNAMGQDSETKSMSNNEIRSSFAKRASVGYVTVVKPEDLAVDRSGGKAEIGVPLVSLVELNIPAYPADALPPELAAIPATKPGSRSL